MSTKLTVFFEDPYWVGVFERVEEEKLSVAKITFGAEPKDYEVYDFILNRYSDLRYSPTVESAAKETARNPKRMQREARKQTLSSGIGTKSQQALQLQREQFKTERRSVSREQKLAEAERLFELKQQKKKEKHRGH